MTDMTEIPSANEPIETEEVIDEGEKRERVRQQKRNDYQRHRRERLAKAHAKYHTSEKVLCECGDVMSPLALRNHKKTQRHIRVINAKLTVTAPNG